MNADDIIKEVQENASEWLEMVENPAELLAGILAGKIVKLNDHIEYLERRVHAYEYSRMSDSRRDTAGKSGVAQP